MHNTFGVQTTTRRRPTRLTLSGGRAASAWVDRANGTLLCCSCANSLGKMTQIEPSRKEVRGSSGESNGRVRCPAWFTKQFGRWGVQRAIRHFGTDSARFKKRRYDAALACSCLDFFIPDIPRPGSPSSCNAIIAAPGHRGSYHYIRSAADAGRDLRSRSLGLTLTKIAKEENMATSGADPWGAKE